jgi:hypothetical protein
MFVYAATIFLSAFLLFQVQPLLAKVILPWFGGGPAVWTTCLLFFQLVLFGGYAYAHLLSSCCRPRQQAFIHIPLLLVALAFLPLEPSVAWRPEDAADPTWRVLGLLGVTVGVPYFLLSATAPLIQSWYGRVQTQHSPYRLYALSNAGSLLALFSYPFLVEPFASVHAQLWAWSAGFASFAALCAYCVWFARGKSPTGASKKEGDAPSREVESTVRFGDIAMWLGLSASASVLLIATTQQLCQEVSTVPFLWILPLSIYLITFIACFESERWYRRRVFAVVMPITVLGASCTLLWLWDVSFMAQIALFSAALFTCCMACHGELARSRPGVSRLTLFYLSGSAGGALGGLFCVSVATALFPKYWEYHIGLLACMVLPLISLYRDESSPFSSGRPRWAWGLLVAATLGIAGILAVDATSEFEEDAVVVTRSRNFYGVLTVYEMKDETGVFYALDHGRIRHGIQYRAPDRRSSPTSYYHPEAGVGLALLQHPKRHAARLRERSLKIGVIGLGAGSLAIYGKRGDSVRFYEIDPEVIRLAETEFSYLQDSPAEVEVVDGDGRIQLEREWAAGEAQDFDVLVLDAFASDAVPMHLLTRQAFELYLNHLDSDGILVFNVTNVYVDLKALIRGTAKQLGYESLWVDWAPKEQPAGFEWNSWILVTRNREFLRDAVVLRRVQSWSKDKNEDLVWTDDYGSLIQVLRF